MFPEMGRAVGATLAAMAAALLTAVAAPAAADIRIKDLVEFDGVRGNDLVGYGLVVGLPGTGDGIRNSPFTEDALSNILERLGVNVTGEEFRPKNVAAVLVTAELPPFARAGRRIDVSVSAIGDASSLRGGTLIMTPLNAADGQIYAVAQGPVIAGGVTVEGEASSITRGVPTGGVIPDGARVEREVDFALTDLGQLRLALRDPDFTTAARIARRINKSLRGEVARMQDSGTVLIDAAYLGGGVGIAEMIAAIENLRVDKDQKARVVIDQRSGTIVLGDDVRISRVAISQGDLTLRIRETPIAVQPNPFSLGETVVVPRTDVDIEEEGEGLALIEEQVSLAALVEGLNALGVSTRQMIDILAAIDAAGALHAEMILH